MAWIEHEVDRGDELPARNVLTSAAGRPDPMTATGEAAQDRDDPARVGDQNPAGLTVHRHTAVVEHEFRRNVRNGRGNRRRGGRGGGRRRRNRGRTRRRNHHGGRRRHVGRGDPHRRCPACGCEETGEHCDAGSMAHQEQAGIRYPDLASRCCAADPSVSVVPKAQRDETISAISSPASVGFWPTLTPAFSNASIFAAAVPFPPETMAPAWPIFLPGGAVTPAM